MIRVLVVDDSALFRTALTAILEKDPDLTVVATAKDGREAVELVRRHRPDIVTMDVNMPVMGGYEAVEKIMALCPTPVVMLTGSPTKQDREGLIKALSLGALDVLAKPDLSRLAEAAHVVREMIEKVKLLSKAHVIRHLAGLRRLRDHRSAVRTSRPEQWYVVAIVASTGGPAALARIFSRLPGDLAASVVVAQHIAEGFTQMLVEWLSSVSSFDVLEGEPGCPLRPGLAAIAPFGRHMEVDSDGRLRLVDSAPVHGCRPSGDVLLTSVSKTFGDRAVGVILSGMGVDGTEGAKGIRTRGGRVVVQHESSCVIFGMPKSAIEAGAADCVLPLDDIPKEIVRLAGRRDTTDSHRRAH